MKQKEGLDMGDFTKELNIIDFLGIGVPGCTLVLLLLGGQVDTLLLAGFFGTDCSELTHAIVLIILGYIAGMLIHEIGDMAEKVLWQIRWLDPKTYAAYAVGLTSLTQTLNDDGKKENFHFHISEWLQTLLSFFAVASLLRGFVRLFLLALDAASKTLEAASAANLISAFSFSQLGGAMYLVMHILFLCLGVIQHTHWGKREMFDHIRSQNPYIQTCVMGYGSSSKRVLFESFRVTMRNLLLVVLVINLFSCWKPVPVYQQICAALALPSQNAQQDSRIFVLCTSTVAFLMLVRYCHYSLLKYKYAYEDYLKKHGKQPEESSMKNVSAQSNPQ